MPFASPSSSSCDHRRLQTSPQCVREHLCRRCSANGTTTRSVRTVFRFYTVFERTAHPTSKVLSSLLSPPPHIPSAGHTHRHRCTHTSHASLARRSRHPPHLRLDLAPPLSVTRRPCLHRQLAARMLLPGAELRQLLRPFPGLPSCANLSCDEPADGSAEHTGDYVSPPTADGAHLLPRTRSGCPIPSTARD